MNVCYKCQKRIEQPEYCGQCGAEIPLFKDACPGCGKTVSWVKFCPKCRNDLRAQAESEGLLSEDKAAGCAVAPAPSVSAREILPRLQHFAYSDNGDGTYVVTGIKNKYVTLIEIPEGVLAIGENAFAGLTVLTKVKLPAGLIVIEAGAFKGCGNLRSINIPDGIMIIGKEAFAGCDKLEKLTVPDTAEVGEGAFDGIPWMTKENARREAAQQKALLKKFKLKKLPDGTYKIKELKDENTEGEIEIPSCVSVIGEFAFSVCEKITSVVIPESVKEIGEMAFYGCKSLVSINIPDGVTSIGGEAFWNCDSLTSVTIPSSVTNIEELAFRGCNSLKDIYCEAASKPSGWNDDWHGARATVHWGVKK